MRTNYMYGRVKRTVTREIYAMTLCMWLKGGASGIGTPFSYSAPGQANELVLIEWGDKPMELLIKDMVREEERDRERGRERESKTDWGQLMKFCSLIGWIQKTSHKRALMV